MPAYRTMHWKLSCLLLASTLLTACVSRPRRSERKDLRLDTETVSRLRHAATVGEAASSLAPAATRTVASSLAWSIPALTALLESEDLVSDFEKALTECARQADRQVNSSSFGNRSPTREDCGEQVEIDACGNRITRAMRLGQQKHVLALQCAQDVLKELWPAPFSLEQRYRYYPNARVLETVSREEEARLIAQGCTGELWRTIKPDIVLHADHRLLRSVLTLDFKFPCPGSNPPRWTEYGESSAYADSNQGQIYKDALGGEALIISPRQGITR